MHIHQISNSVDLASIVTTTRIAIPDTAAETSRPASWVRLTATDYIYVRPGDSAVDAIVGDILVIPTEALYLNVAGFTDIAAINRVAANIDLNIAVVEF